MEEVATSFRQLLGKKICADCDVFLGDTQENVEARVHQLAREQSLYVAKGHEMEVAPTDLISQSSKKHYALYEEKYRQRMEEMEQELRLDECFGRSGEATKLFTGFAGDLLQNPQSRDMSRSNGMMPALTTKTLRYSHSQQRFYTWRELYMCQLAQLAKPRARGRQRQDEYAFFG